MKHNAKRVKLSLEPTTEKIAIDITETGHEIYKTELSLPEQLMRNVDRVWYERGDWKDITEEGLQGKQAKSENNMDVGTTTDMTGTHSTNEEKQRRRSDETVVNLKNDSETALVNEPKLRESVISKLYFAKCEIDVALDVINILATENKSSTNEISGVDGGGSSGSGGASTGVTGLTTGQSSMTGGGLTDNNNGGNHNLVLPPGTLRATYVSKPNLPGDEQLEQSQLTLGLKRKQQKAAADYLKKSAASLKKLVDQEHCFWDEAVQLRSNHWIVQASSSTTTGGSGLLIDYGFKEVGSHFAEISHGEMVRSHQGAKQKVQLSLPHNLPKQIQVTIKQRQLDQMNSDVEAVLRSGGSEEMIYQDLRPSIHKTNISATQRQLIDAQTTVYDAELFSHILSEAQVIPYNIECEENRVTVILDGQIDILIQKTQLDQLAQQPANEATTLSSSQQLIGHTIGMALRLLLAQRHRFNLWKSRTRLMSRQRKTQQLLNSIGDTTSLLASATGTPGSTAIINNPMISTGPNMTSTGNTSTGGGSGGSSSTPIISHRTVGNISSAGGTSSTKSRQLTSGSSYHHSTKREPSSEIPILSPVISMTRFWILLHRIRKVIHRTIDPLCGETGLGLAVHYKSQHILNNGPHYYCEAYPSYGELACSIAINVLKGPSLQFALNQSGTIIATLAGNVVILSNVTEFEAFLLREINLICLHAVCDIANDVILRSSAYKAAKSAERNAYIWQVDEVEEILYGAVKTNLTTGNQPKWKHIQVHLNKTTEKLGSPGYILQFKEGSSVAQSSSISSSIHYDEHKSRKHHLAERYILLSQWQGADMAGIKSGITFKDKVTMMIHQLLE